MPQIMDCLKNVLISHASMYITKVIVAVKVTVLYL